MDFLEIIEQARDVLKRKGRVTYRTLQRQFRLDDEALNDLKEELIDAERVASDEEGRILVWVGDNALTPTPTTNLVQTQTPASYTPQHLAERILAEQAAMESRGSYNGERKTITALFADLKGSTALIEGLDPEDARAIIDPALQLMMDAVHRYDGYVAQALGDGIFALFGAPIAHEDHPQRALYAVLRMQEEMRAYSDQTRLKGGIPLQMRVGINTGEVVVRSIRKDDLHTDYVPVGHSTNLAARMEQLATPGSIVISEYTRQLTEGYFELKALGAAEIKGVEEPLNVYEVLGAGPLRTRLQVSVRRGLTRFVGRQGELDQMRQALEQAKAGHGQIVGVMGEPGQGKSRLFYEFKLTSQSGCLALEAFSISYGKASPYLPLIELLKSYFEIEPTDDEQTRRQKVLGHVLDLDRSLEETLPYLFALLGIDAPESSLQQMDAQIRRQRAFEALKKLFLRESLNQPLLLLFEDLHWIDSETQGFLETLSESVASANVLLLVNYRPEFRHEWGSKTYYTQLRLAPLGQAEAVELLTFLLGTEASLTRLKALILEKTEGTPFFMEEVVQTLAEEGALTGERGNYHLESTPTALHISPTVQGVLAARIDRLTVEEKALLQQLSVIGRQFPVSLVKHVVPQAEAELYRVLSLLQAKEFLYEQSAFPEVEYLFKHALTQDVAYGTVLQEQRKALHERTGQAMEALYKDSLEEHYSELAYHYRHSENIEKAVEYLGLAGQQAAQRSANEEALRQLTLALELLVTLPETLGRDQQELTLQLTLGDTLIVAKGWGASEAERVYARVQALGQQLGAVSQVIPALWGLWNYYSSRQQLPAARDLAEQMLSLAQQEDPPHFLSLSHATLGLTAHTQGELSLARQHLTQGLSVYTPPPAQAPATLVSQNSRVECLAYLSHVLWLLGYPAQALSAGDQALHVARELPHPYNVAMALAWASILHINRREWNLAEERAEELLALATEQHFPPWEAVGLNYRGAVVAERGEVEEGIAYIRQGLDTLKALGVTTWHTLSLTHLANVYMKANQPDGGLRRVDDGLTIVETTDEKFYAAALYQAKGELLLQQSPEAQAEAEECIHKALAIARQQEAKSWELRAATSLARLWQQQGKQAEARDVLAPVYDWFTEGFDTADLQDAKALLSALTEH